MVNNMYPFIANEFITNSLKPIRIAPLSRTEDDLRKITKRKAAFS